MNYSADLLDNMRQGCKLQARIRNGEKNLHWQQWHLEERRYELIREAAESFAKLNGWKCGASFHPAQLARGSTQRKRNEWDDGDHELFDHPMYFREPARPYRPAAIVAQPYGTPVGKAMIIALNLGLELHWPSNLTASWWFPGSTRFYCCTRFGQTVRFLPEQCSASSRDDSNKHNEHPAL
jgi:hypothetical protein